jgi:hypothetical protein
LTKESFFKEIRDYYGDHENKKVMRVTEAYVEKLYSESNYRDLLSAVYRSHPSSWGYPDVAAIESAHEKFMRSNRNLKIHENTEWRSPIQPLTDEERAEAEKMRGNWESFLDEVVGKVKDEISCISCDHVKPTKTGVCEGCSGYSKYEKKNG